MALWRWKRWKKKCEKLGEFETSGNFKEKNKREDGEGGKKGVDRPKGNGASHFLSLHLFSLTKNKFKQSSGR